MGNITIMYKTEFKPQLDTESPVTDTALYYLYKVLIIHYRNKEYRYRLHVHSLTRCHNNITLYIKLLYRNTNKTTAIC